jgi:hypothetical protein
MSEEQRNRPFASVAQVANIVVQQRQLRKLSPRRSFLCCELAERETGDFLDRTFSIGGKA